MRESALQQIRFGKPVAESLFELSLQVIARTTSGWCRHSQFGALSCVVLAFLADSIPLLQFGCSVLWMAAHCV